MFRQLGLQSFSPLLALGPAQQDRALVSVSEQQPKLLVVHPKQKAPAVLLEALRLAESYAGQLCLMHILYSICLSPSEFAKT